VKGDDAALLRNEEAVLLLQASNDPFHCIGEIGQMHAVCAAPRRQERCLVDQIGEVGAGKAGRQFGDLLGIDVGRQYRLFQVDVQYRDAILLVGAVDQNLTIEAAGAQQRRIQDLRPVGRRQQDDADRRIETVHLHEELIERLLLFGITAIRKGSAGAAQRVELVDKDDRRRLLARLVEQVAHPRGADADKHFDELGAGNRKELDACLARDRASQQRLAGAWRADQKHALGNVGSEPAVSFRVLQEVDDLLQLLLSGS
jgi:hypothetical protein